MDLMSSKEVRRPSLHRIALIEWNRGLELSDVFALIAYVAQRADGFVHFPIKKKMKSQIEWTSFRMLIEVDFW
jgi:hypothetical protein